MPPLVANTSRELNRMSSTQMPVIGIPACVRKIKERLIHTVADKYPSAIIDAAGCLPVLIPAIGARVDVSGFLDRLDGLLLTGSPSNVHPSQYGRAPSYPETLHDPERDATTLPLIREAVRRDLPLLAICRGIQELNVALGGPCTKVCMSSPAGSIIVAGKIRLTAPMARLTASSYSRAGCWRGSPERPRSW